MNYFYLLLEKIWYFFNLEFFNFYFFSWIIYRIL